jgi:peptidyl-prolyl cis-trans isomerase C
VTASRGGDLGPILEGQVDPVFFAEAAALKGGQISKPFQTTFGFHVVKALEEPAVVTPGFDDVRGVLAAEARTTAERALLERLRGQISVELHPERLSPPPAAASPATTGEPAP